VGIGRALYVARPDGAVTEERPRSGREALDVEGHVALKSVLSRLLGRRESFQVGRYHLRRRLGQGAFGVVYLAWDPELDRDVALKLIRPGSTRRVAKLRARLQREAQSLARLRHPHVVGVYDIGATRLEHDDDATLFLVMELVRGRTLSEWVEHDRPSWPEILDTYLVAARALAAAHAVGIVHRDFKPGNAMIDDRGEVKVLDFGLARREDASDVDSSTGSHPSMSATWTDEQLTQSGVLLGTPRYMSPEQHRSEPASPASDQFAFCAALWEALYARPAFTARSPRALLQAKEEGLPRRRPPGPAPRALHDVLRRGMHPDPARRFRDMHELIAALGRGRRRKHGASRAAIASLAIGLTGSAVVHDDPTPPCELPALDDAWTPERRAAVEAIVASRELEDAPKTWRRLDMRAERHLAELGVLRDEVCAAGPSTRSDGELRCIHRGIESLRETLGALEREDELASAMRRLWALRPAHWCERASMPGEPVRTPEEQAELDEIDAALTRLAILPSGERPEDPGAFVDRALERSRALSDHVLTARLLDHRADLEASGGDMDKAARSIDEAVGVALHAGDPLLAAETVPQLLRYQVERDISTWAYEPVLRRARTLIAEADDPPGPLANVHWINGLYHARRGDEATAKEELERVLQLAESTGEVDEFTHTQALLSLGSIAIQERDYDRAVEMTERALEAAPPPLLNGHQTLAFAHLHLSAVALFRGQYDVAATEALASISFLQAVWGPEHPMLAWQTSWYGNVLFARGAEVEGIALMQAAVDRLTAGAGSEAPYLVAIMHNLMRAHSKAGHHEEALALAVRVRERLVSRGDEHQLAVMSVRIAELELELGRVREAARRLREAEALDPALGGRLSAALGRVALARGKWDEADRLLRHAIEDTPRSDDEEDRERHALATWRLSQLQARRGRGEEAERLAAAAHDALAAGDHWDRRRAEAIAGAAPARP
jgi:tetratricopeptide (TPR) repeat protein/predicted Ser/Thr protein kinase